MRKDCLEIRMRRKAWRPLIFAVHCFGYIDKDYEEVVREW